MIVARPVVVKTQSIIALSAAGHKTSLASQTTKPFQHALEGSEDLAKQIKLVAGVGFTVAGSSRSSRCR
ncbi:hypothetical protein GCM10017044_28690 [Kordiimonas sediminis]|uniref:Uncharacterized protein n=1 Tax=Kordiimonas sediminis TaxID=1735581 RepID=A0A919AZR9_9PROT|nr:hypothetical protein GCM10017044_28690 [Kordiimonas sediminis]